VSPHITFIRLCACLLALASVGRSAETRDRFAAPLPTMSVALNEKTDSLEEVFFSCGHSMEGWAITRGDDRYIKLSARKREDFYHREMPEFAGQLSEFEAEQLNQVAGNLVQTLNIFEKDLQNERWGRLRYLDERFAPFLRGFYYMVNAAYNWRHPLPPTACAPTHFFDDSAKTDKRIMLWRTLPDQRTKLRIVARELAFQTEQWQDKELDNAKRDPLEDYGRKFREAYGLFVRLYFNALVPPLNPTDATRKAGP